MSTPAHSSSGTPQQAASSRSSSSRSKKPTKIVVLRLPPSSLGRFVQDESPGKDSKSKPTGAPAIKLQSDSLPPENGSESNATPVPAQNGEVNGDAEKEDYGSKTTNGVKRSASALDENETPKPRGKPGPKKKPRIEGEGESSNNANNSRRPAGGAGAGASHKLGPKANQGAINAGLRALDRKGNQCRRWHKKGFQIKSFTRVEWNMPSWRTPQSKNPALHGDMKSGSNDSSEAKVEGASSAVGSENEKSNNAGVNGDAAPAAVEPASSPAPHPELVVTPNPA